MAYKTILVQVDDSARAAARMTLAARIASQEGAHLIGAANTGVAEFLYQNAALEYNDPNLSDYFDALRLRATKALAPFEPLVRRHGVASSEARLLDDAAGRGFEELARCCDLVVVGQPDPAEPAALGRDLPESALLHSARPVLILPPVGPTETRLERVMLAWDGGIEAAHAVAGALPLLCRAAAVEIVVFNGQATHLASGAPPGSDLLQALRRHGAKAELTHQKTRGDVGQALLAHARDLSADLLVMGGYGRSRFRELLLGGATRTVLEAMALPVLMAH